MYIKNDCGYDKDRRRLKRLKDQRLKNKKQEQDDDDDYDDDDHQPRKAA